MNLSRSFQRVILLILLSLCAISAYSQENRFEVGVDFRVNETSIDSTYSDNALRLKEIDSLLRLIRQDSTVRIVEVSFRGAASPEGSYELNRRLAHKRLESLERFFRDRVDVPDSIISRNDGYIPWDYLKSQIEASDLSRKDDICRILDNEAVLVQYYQSDKQIDDRVVKLRALDGGETWQQLNKLFFSDMRNASVSFATCREAVRPVVATEPAPDTVKSAPSVPAPEAPLVATEKDWYRRLHIKTNILGLGMAIANLGIEIDLARHLSLSLPVYYSAWDYIRSTVKFRTLTVQPELRFWPSRRNDGFFAGAHFGLGYYNFAYDSDYRYQDHDGETPAMGGGVSVGYRLPLRKESRWRVEFSLGAGVYPAHYDMFHNTADVRYGLLAGSEKMTYWGIDQAAVSFSYSFDLKKKGGRR